LTASDRAAIVQALARGMNANYIEPAVAKRAGSAIARKNAEGGYASAVSAQAFSEALAKDLREFSGDLHFKARFNERFRERSSTADAPGRVAYLMSHFFPPGDRRHLNDIYNRSSNTTQAFWTLASVRERYRKPVYVLTSARTGSGAEECADDFQTQKRATLVGETTAGAANPLRPFSVGHGILVWIPFARAISSLPRPVGSTSA
jgi:hypothetical protein